MFVGIGEKPISIKPTKNSSKRRYKSCKGWFPNSLIKNTRLDVNKNNK